MATGAASTRLMYYSPGKDLVGMTAETVLIGGLIDAVMRLMALIAVEPRHGGVAGKNQLLRFFVAGETHLMAR
jgi:hypothetical protein